MRRPWCEIRAPGGGTPSAPRRTNLSDSRTGLGREVAFVSGGRSTGDGRHAFGSAGYRSASEAMTASSSPGSTGLGTWLWKPARSTRVRSSERA
ncbi:hypothetical protein COEX109129_25150 [Corallococcus exiguus]